MRSVTLTIDLNALAYNFAKVRELAPNCQVFAVIKSNAYGHDALACAAKLTSLTDGFAVVTMAEALSLRESGIELPILVLQGHRVLNDVQQAITHNLNLVVHCQEQIDLLVQASKTLSQSVSVWVKLDTGMGRLGIKKDDVDSSIDQLKSIKHVRIEGMMTHFSCADEPDNPFTLVQLERYQKSTQGYKADSSLANSAAILAWPDTHQGWVRPGIMLYGVNPHWPKDIPTLKPVMCVEAPIIAIRKMQCGETIGYANTYACEEDCEVAVVAIGYGDGYPRHITADAYVLIGDDKCHILGRVSMDSIVVALPHNHSSKLQDSVILWGKQDLTVERVAKFANTLSYELLCQIRGKKQFLGRPI